MNDKKQDDPPRRPLYFYDLPPEVLESLTLKTNTHNVLTAASETTQTASTQLADVTEDSTTSTGNSLGAKSCALCTQNFAALDDQRSHLKSDLHYYNLKQKLRGRPVVTDVEFEKLIGDLDESLSGSDSGSSDEDNSQDEGGSHKKDTVLTALLKKQESLVDVAKQNDNDEGALRLNARGSGTPPMLWFSSSTLPQNHYYGIYRVIFTPEELKAESAIVEVIKKKQLASIPEPPRPGSNGEVQTRTLKIGPHIFLCMIGGGHFAAMVVSLAPRKSKHASSSGPLNKEAVVLAHKTFHRYTTRRKQGGSQSANDNAKGNAHSAGSSIRRYNEQALTDEVRLLLHEWKYLLDTAELMFIRATGSTNRRTLFGPYEGQVLRANDPRIRGFPFSTKRATQNELMRSFIELTRFKVREFDPNQSSEASEAPAKPVAPKAVKPAPPKLSEDEETALLHTSQLQSSLRRSKLPALLSYLQKNHLSPDFLFQPADQNHHAPTCLHLAASQNSAPLVLGLLAKAGADPTLKIDQGKVAFDLAGDRATRDAFRVARSELGEEKWDWEIARIPPAITKIEADKREERERKENEAEEAKRRKAEEARLKKETPRVNETNKSTKKGILQSTVAKTAQEKREEEARGLTPEQRMKLDRERRARAAEERIRRLQGGGGGG